MALRNNLSMQPQSQMSPLSLEAMRLLDKERISRVETGIESLSDALKFIESWNELNRSRLKGDDAEPNSEMKKIQVVLNEWNQLTKQEKFVRLLKESSKISFDLQLMHSTAIRNFAYVASILNKEKNKNDSKMAVNLFMEEEEKLISLLQEEANHLDKIDSKQLKKEDQGIYFHELAYLHEHAAKLCVANAEKGEKWSSSTLNKNYQETAVIYFKTAEELFLQAATVAKEIKKEVQYHLCKKYAKDCELSAKGLAPIVLSAKLDLEMKKFLQGWNDLRPGLGVTFEKKPTEVLRDEQREVNKSLAVWGKLLSNEEFKILIQHNSIEKSVQLRMAHSEAIRFSLHLRNRLCKEQKNSREDILLSIDLLSKEYDALIELMPRNNAYLAMQYGELALILKQRGLLYLRLAKAEAKTRLREYPNRLFEYEKKGSHDLYKAANVFLKACAMGVVDPITFKKEAAECYNTIGFIKAPIKIYADIVSQYLIDRAKISFNHFFSSVTNGIFYLAASCFKNRNKNSSGNKSRELQRIIDRNKAVNDAKQTETPPSSIVLKNQVRDAMDENTKEGEKKRAPSLFVLERRRKEKEDKLRKQKAKEQREKALLAEEAMRNALKEKEKARSNHSTIVALRSFTPVQVSTPSPTPTPSPVQVSTPSTTPSPVQVSTPSTTPSPTHLQAKTKNGNTTPPLIKSQQKIEEFKRKPYAMLRSLARNRYVKEVEIAIDARMTNRDIFYKDLEHLAKVSPETIDRIHSNFLELFSGNADIKKNLSLCNKKMIQLLFPTVEAAVFANLDYIADHMTASRKRGELSESGIYGHFIWETAKVLKKPDEDIIAENVFFRTRREQLLSIFKTWRERYHAEPAKGISSRQTAMETVDSSLSQRYYRRT